MKKTHEAPAAPATPATPRFDPIQFTLTNSMASPRELAVGFGQLIDSIADISGVAVDRVITPGLSAVTVSWLAATIPSDDWLLDVESQVRAFAACNGVQVLFRRH